jgi:large subunit ribosomal protein L15
MLHLVRPAKGATKRCKRVGRGPGSGHGKTSCKGHKGSRARAGGGKGPGFEGGQMPLQRRLPKKGFRHEREVVYAVVNLKQLAVFGAGDQVTPETLAAKGVIRKPTDKVKLLAVGEVAGPLAVRVHAVSGAARGKIEAAGGSVEVLR